MKGLSSLEKQVLAAMARADRERAIMEEQIGAVAVASRDYTGVGSFTKLCMLNNVRRLDLSRWRFEDMPYGFAWHPELSGGASFILWIKHGRLHTLEGFTNGGDWPTDEAAFSVEVSPSR